MSIIEIKEIWSWLKKHVFIIALCLISAATMYYTYEYAQQYSVIGFCMVAWAFVEAAIFYHDRVMWQNVDIQEELKKGNLAVAQVVKGKYIAIALIIAAALLAVPKAAGQELRHVAMMESFVGTKEIKPNRSAVADRANSYVKAALGSPYCASTVSLCLGLTNVQYPTVRTAWAKGFILKNSILLPAKNLGNCDGYILVFTRRGGGHVGLIKTVRNMIAETIEANTSSGISGSQHDGDGIWRRVRDLKKLSSPYNAFRATAITPVKV